MHQQRTASFHSVHVRHSDIDSRFTFHDDGTVSATFAHSHGDVCINGMPQQLAFIGKCLLEPSENERSLKLAITDD